MQLSDVLMLGGDQPQLGTPMVSGASVAVEIMQQSRGPKVIAFKKRRRKNSRRKRGHRQDFTLVRISEILTDGKSPIEKGQRPAAAEAEGREGRRRGDNGQDQGRQAREKAEGGREKARRQGQGEEQEVGAGPINAVDG